MPDITETIREYKRQEELRERSVAQEAEKEKQQNQGSYVGLAGKAFANESFFGGVMKNIQEDYAVGGTLLDPDFDVNKELPDEKIMQYPKELHKYLLGAVNKEELAWRLQEADELKAYQQEIQSRGIITSLPALAVGSLFGDPMTYITGGFGTVAKGVKGAKAGYTMLEAMTAAGIDSTAAMAVQPHMTWKDVALGTAGAAVLNTGLATIGKTVGAASEGVANMHKALQTIVDDAIEADAKATYRVAILKNNKVPKPTNDAEEVWLDKYVDDVFEYHQTLGDYRAARTELLKLKESESALSAAAPEPFLKKAPAVKKQEGVPWIAKFEATDKPATIKAHQDPKIGKADRRTSELTDKYKTVISDAAKKIGYKGTIITDNEVGAFGSVTLTKGILSPIRLNIGAIHHMAWKKYRQEGGAKVFEAVRNIVEVVLAHEEVHLRQQLLHNSKSGSINRMPYEIMSDAFEDEADAIAYRLAGADPKIFSRSNRPEVAKKMAELDRLEQEGEISAASQKELDAYRAEEAAAIGKEKEWQQKYNQYVQDVDALEKTLKEQLEKLDKLASPVYDINGAKTVKSVTGTEAVTADEVTIIKESQKIAREVRPFVSKLAKSITGQVLNSDNDVALALMYRMGEYAPGFGGKYSRGRTMSVYRDLFDREFMSSWAPRFQTAEHDYFKATKTDLLDNFRRSQKQLEFNTAVQRELNARRFQPTDALKNKAKEELTRAERAITEAADAIKTVRDRMYFTARDAGVERFQAAGWRENTTSRKWLPSQFWAMANDPAMGWAGIEDLLHKAIRNALDKVAVPAGKTVRGEAKAAQSELLKVEDAIARIEKIPLNERTPAQQTELYDLSLRSMQLQKNFDEASTKAAGMSQPVYDINGAKTVKTEGKEVTERMSRAWAAAIVRRNKENVKNVQGFSNDIFSIEDRAFISDLLSEIGADDIQKETFLRALEKSKQANTTSPVIEMDLNTTHNGHDIWELLDPNLSANMVREVKRVAGEIAMAKGGFKSQKEFNDRLELVTRYALNRGLDIESAKKDVKYLDAARKLLLGETLEADPAGDLAKGLQLVRDMVQLGTLNWAGFAQLSEFGKVVSRVGVKSAVENIAMFKSAIRDMKTGKMNNPWLSDLEDAFQFRIGDDHIMNNPSYRLDANNIGQEVTWDATGMQKFAGLVRRLKHVQGFVNGMNMIKTMQDRVLAAGLAKKICKQLDVAEVSESVTRRMSDIGIDADMIPRVQAMIRQQDWKNTNNMGLAKWSDVEAKNTVMLAMQRAWAQDIQKAMVGEQYLWTQTTLGKLFAQFRTFTLGAIEKQTLHSLKMHDLEAFMLTTYGLLFGTAAYLSKTYTQALGENDPKAFLEERLKTQAIVSGGANLLGQSSIAPELFHLAGWVTGQEEYDLFRYSFDRGTGITRRGSGADLGALAPSGAYVQRLLRTIQNSSRAITDSEFDYSRRDAEDLIKILPLMNNVFAGVAWNSLLNNLPEKN